MLESEIKKLTAAVEANTVALTGGVPVAAAAPVIVAPVAGAGAAPAEVSTAIEIPIDVPAAGAAEVIVPPAADLKQITEGIVALCKAKGRESAAKLMAEYGAQKVPDLKKVADKYDEILAKINALIAAP